MLQRIQTVYLIIVAMLCIASSFCTLVTFYNGATIMAEFSNWYFSTFDSNLKSIESLAPTALGTLLILVFLITIMTIMLFHYRMRQMRLIIISTILLFGYVILMALLVVKFQLEIQSMTNADTTFSIHIANVFPVVSIILNFLAIHGIRKDEKLVRSLDRIR
ncbi:MAG: DUF4293 domain-containing protein [Bacteroidaceae bacterium]|nr:DUF4293 domain-containing protein [Bacteroidaceae bacterium]